MTFSSLVTKLADAIASPHTGAVNEVQCQVEAEIIGYLMGRKVAKNDAKYVPKGFGDHSSQLLETLNRVASKASVVLLRAKKKERTRGQFSEETFKTQRD